MSVPKPIAILAIDIETSGPHASKDSILSLGMCLGTTSGKVIEKKRIDFQPLPGVEFDEDTMANFWAYNQEKLTVFLNNGVTPALAISQFADIVDNLDVEYDLRIVTDNPSLDIAFINQYYEEFLDRLPINYKSNNRDQYRPIYDTDSYNRGFMRQTHEKQWTMDSDVIKYINVDQKSVPESNHWPEDDAEHIYKLHVAVLKNVPKPAVDWALWHRRFRTVFNDKVLFLLTAGGVYWLMKRLQIW